MKYETPELTTLTPAINAIQNPEGNGPVKVSGMHSDGGVSDQEFISGYMDWED
jgi:hypothetical protein